MRARVAILVAVLLAGCGGLNRLERKLTPDASTLDSASAFLKIHTRSGAVYVLSPWHTDSAAGAIVGTGVLLAPNRDTLGRGDFRVPADSAALYETNVLKSSGAKTALMVMVGITAGVAVYCATNTKACFGSCPTFYADGALVAEGFSASIAPALEATDLDMLPRVRASRRDFTLEVTNEALETHVIRWADLIVVPRESNGRIFVTPEGDFREAKNLTAPLTCQGAEGDCLRLVAELDGRERFSTADSTDLATRETLEIELPAMTGDIGVVLSARQTFLTTFLIYQSLAYLGTNAGSVLAALSQSNPALREGAGALGRALGKIEVLVERDGEWHAAGAMGETGPLAADTKVIPIPENTTRIRVRMTRGLWRLDYVALAQLGTRLEPMRLRPARVTRGGTTDTVALAALLDSARVLTTLPGDRYTLHYRLPPSPERYELFLEARGYYLEWMRREWLAEENRALAFGMFVDPGQALRRLAPAFKRIEPEMERVFWGSRYAPR
jgi:hypothetical protein